MMLSSVRFRDPALTLIAGWCLLVASDRNSVSEPGREVEALRFAGCEPNGK